MCGIVGLWDFEAPVDSAVLESMRDTLAHRGPDDSGLFVDPAAGVGLGHRRLTILDLTPAGHQPMSFDGVWIVHNGEVYNFKELRRQLTSLGYTFQSNSDTEVVLKSYREWGLGMLERFRGMFATVLWDTKERRLHLIRDRAGVKPLYYFWDGHKFIFASELRAVLAHPGVHKVVNRDALVFYFKLGYVPAPYSIFANVFKLEPGHVLTVTAEKNLQDQTYWNVLERFRELAPRAASTRIDETAAADELEKVLAQSFKERMVSDVPVGVFLSGGIDSTLVAAMLQKDSTSRLKTFTVGFEEKGYNEAEEAKNTAVHIGTDHQELYLDSRMALDIIPRLPDIYDEPFGDASGIPTYLVSRFAREHVKVALSADGGDELFAGYRIHHSLRRAFKIFSRLGPFRKQLIGLGGLPPIKGLLEKKPGGAQEKLRKLAEIVAGEPTWSRFYFTARGFWGDAEFDGSLARGRAAAGFLAPFEAVEGDVGGFMNFMRAADFRSYMCDDILVKVDRASMAVGLESREPFLDQRIVDYAAGLPVDLLTREGETKRILKRILFKYVPREMVERPKKGFVVPLDVWLKKELRPVLTDYVTKTRIASEGVLDWSAVRAELDAFLRGRVTRSDRLWLVLEYELWREKWTG